MVESLSFCSSTHCAPWTRLWKAPRPMHTQQPERDCRRKIGCRLMNLGNSCYQNWCDEEALTANHCV